MNKKITRLIKFYVYFFLSKINNLFKNKYNSSFVLCDTKKEKLFEIFKESNGAIYPIRIEKEATFFMYKKPKEIVSFDKIGTNTYSTIKNEICNKSGKDIIEWI